MDRHSRTSLYFVVALVAGLMGSSPRGDADELPFEVGYDRPGAEPPVVAAPPIPDLPPLAEPRTLTEPRPLPIAAYPAELPSAESPAPSFTSELATDPSPSDQSLVGPATPSADLAYCSPSFWDRDKLTGDWWGWRTCLTDCGVTFDLMATQYYQGVAAGGLRDEFRYGGKFDGYVNVDGAKVGLWDGFSINMHAESQFGDDVNPYDGAIVPNNFAILFPQPGGHATAITALKFTQTVGDHLAVFGGRMNILDEYQNPFAAGYGRDRFINSAFVLPPMFYPAISYSYLGAGFAVIKDNEPVLIVKVLDPSARATRAGFDTLFENGASILTIAKLPVRPMGLLGHHGVGVAWNGGTFYPPYASDWTPGPAPDLGLGAESGVWNILYGYDQELWVDSANPSRKFGLFTQAALSDGRPNVYRWFFTAGVSGTSFLRSRPSDTWGCGYYLTGISGDLSDASAAVGYPMGTESGVELYYNVAVSRWCHVTPDLQILEPSRQDADTTLVFGIRAKVDF